MDAYGYWYPVDYPVNQWWRYKFWPWGRVLWRFHVARIRRKFR